MKNKEKPFIEKEFCLFYGAIFIAFGIGLYFGTSINPLSNNAGLFIGVGFLGLLMALIEKQRWIIALILAIASFTLGVLI